MPIGAPTTRHWRDWKLVALEIGNSPTWPGRPRIRSWHHSPEIVGLILVFEGLVIQSLAYPLPSQLCDTGPPRFSSCTLGRLDSCLMNNTTDPSLKDYLYGLQDCVLQVGGFAASY